MSLAEISVFECDDLRNLIFSFIRKYPEKECHICKDVLIWDKKRIKQFVEMTWVINSPIKSFCMKCWQNNVYMGPPCQIC